MDKIQELLSAGDVLEALHQPGSTEEEFYDEAINRIHSDSRTASGIRRHLGFRILGWVLRATRPLEFKELQAALAMSASMASKSNVTKSLDVYNIKEQDLLTACHGLIVIESKTRLVTFAHATVKEYMHAGVKKFPFAIDEELAKTCLSYISRDVFASGPCEDDETFASRMHNNPFYSYATQYWGGHVRGEKLESALKENVLEFLGSNDLILSSVQAKCIEENHYTFSGRSQSYTKHVNGLWVASFVGLYYIATALINKNANVNAQDGTGRTALMIAAMEGHTS
ncbi:hypothetical protein FQN49_002587, partial [Arthroderma sp. PD_2]